MSSSLCDAFTKASIDTWYRIQEGRALRYPLGEETLTDLFLRDLLRLHLPDITIEVTGLACAFRPKSLRTIKMSSSTFTITRIRKTNRQYESISVTS
jgi:hypothetical protein